MFVCGQSGLKQSPIRRKGNEKKSISQNIVQLYNIKILCSCKKSVHLHIVSNIII